MPCDTITTVQLVLKPSIVRVDWLKTVVERFGNIVEVNEEQVTWNTGSWNRKTGILIERTEAAAKKLRQSYAAELTRRTLGRAGWQIKSIEQGGR